MHLWSPRAREHLVEVGLSRAGSIQEVGTFQAGTKQNSLGVGRIREISRDISTGPKRDSLGVGRNCAVSSMSLRLIVTGGTVTRVKNFESIGAEVE